MSKITPHFFVLGIPEKDDRCPNAVYFLRTYSGVSMYATDSKNRIFPIEVGSPSPISGLISPKGTISIRLNGLTTEIDVSKSILDELDVIRNTGNNKPKKFVINSPVSATSETLGLKGFCTYALNAAIPVITIEDIVVPYFHTVYRNEYIVFTLDDLEAGISLGVGETDITPDEIQIISRRLLNLNALDNTSTKYITVKASVSETDNIWERVNLDTYNVQPLSTGFTIFQKEINGEVVYWLYRGNSGTVGDGGYQTQEQDFQRVSSQEVTVPTFQNIIDSENFGEARFISGVEWEDDGEEVSFKKNNSYFGISGTSVNINSDDLRILNSTSADEGKLLIPDGSGSFKLVEPPFPKINDTSDNTTEVLSSEKTRDLIEGKVDKEAGKGLSSNDFTNILKEKLEQQRDTIIISGNKFTYIPAIGNDGSSFQLGDIAKDGWMNEDTFGRVLTYKGTGDATLLSSWKTLQSVKLNNEIK